MDTENPTCESIMSKCINAINSLKNDQAVKDILKLKSSFTIVVPLDDTQKELTKELFKNYKFGNQKVGNDKYKFGSRPLRYLFRKIVVDEVMVFFSVHSVNVVMYFQSKYDDLKIGYVSTDDFCFKPLLKYIDNFAGANLKSNSEERCSALVGIASLLPKIDKALKDRLVEETNNDKIATEYRNGKLRVLNNYLNSKLEENQ